MSKPKINVFKASKDEKHNQDKVGYVSLYKEPKQALIEGGKVKFEENKELIREIEISDNFATSQRIKEVKFCNFVPHKTPSELCQCCATLEKNLGVIYESNSQIDFDRANAKRLHTILDEYTDLSKTSRIGKIFKYDAELSTVLGTYSSSMRIYFQIENEPNEKTSYKLIFCDPYHLAIPSFHKGKNPKQMMESTYRNNSGNGKHIRELFESL